MGKEHNRKLWQHSKTHRMEHIENRPAKFLLHSMRLALEENCFSISKSFKFHKAYFRYKAMLKLSEIRMKVKL